MSTHPLFYRGDGAAARPDTLLPASNPALATSPQGYRADPGLADAVNVALLLGKPLLLTGEPGTGKTQLAFSLAWELGLESPLRFDTKSTSKSKDLFYTFDAVGRFQDKDPSRGPLDYLRYQGLGRAILFSNPAERVRHLLPQGLVHAGARRSVVLIDEVDKAPRDFPNDLLVELEENYFLIPELANAKVSVEESLRPIVVITSNSEKHLPDAFLRRCIYYDIQFPSRERLQNILSSRLGTIADPAGAFVKDALDFFAELRRDASGLRKRPATDELLGWISALARIAPGVANPLAADGEYAKRTLSVLVKTREDQPIAAAILAEWMRRKSR